MAEFRAAEFLPEAIVARITAMRVDDPGASKKAALARRRRTQLTTDGRLSILAADHPARNVTQVGADPLAMADRRDFLSRILRVVSGDDCVDGVMATMDILEDLLILDRLVQDGGGPSFLDEKLLLPSLNRGGLAGSAWELDDPVTGPGPEACAAWNMDGGKLLLRVSERDSRSLDTIRACADVITRMNALDLPTFLEPLPVVEIEGGFKVVKEAGPLAKLIGVASALGDSSHRTWLKLPYCDDYQLVARSTTMPILLLGGPSAGDPKPMLQQVAAGMAAGHNVRGALVGRNVLYPGDADPRAIATAVSGLVHDGLDVDRAVARGKEASGRDLDRITQWFEEGAAA